MFWVLTSVELHVDTTVSEEYSASVFRAENQNRDLHRSGNLKLY
jgi:hypothetical protein